MPSELAPTAADDRIGMLDTARGIAVFGILMMNITGFGLPYAYDDPTVWGYDSAADLAVWRVMALCFEGTMRGLFTLLFGAGALLFLQRHAAHSTDFRPADLYFRRTLWLLAFGLLNGYVLLWSGDVLFHYGVVGLALFVFHKLSPRPLILLATVLMFLQTSITVSEWSDYRDIQAQAQAASARQMAGQALTASDQEALQEFAALQGEFRPAPENLEAHVANVRHDYFTALSVLSGDTWFAQTEYFFRHGLLEFLGMMLLGMALLQLGVLTGVASTRTYISMLVIGYAIGLTVNLAEVRQLEDASFAPEVQLRSFITYDLGRIPMTLGHLGLIGLVCRAQWLSNVSRLFAAAGRMALTNYLSQSLLCMFIFTGAGLAWYGQLPRHELYYVVVAIWVLQLVWSSLWLRHFRYGPAEWAWRSLTYGRRQPLRYAAPTAPQVSTSMSPPT